MLTGFACCVAVSTVAAALAREQDQAKESFLVHLLAGLVSPEAVGSLAREVEWGCLALAW